MAYSAAGSSFTELIYFLGMLSINLAVLNFLPIPPLDGGQMLFLIAEKVRGRPLPESALIAGTYLGLILVLSLDGVCHLSRCLPSVHGLTWPKPSMSRSIGGGGAPATCEAVVERSFHGSAARSTGAGRWPARLRVEWSRR